jgi:hypothetical protein
MSIQRLVRCVLASVLIAAAGVALLLRGSPSSDSVEQSALPLLKAADDESEAIEPPEPGLLGIYDSAERSSKERALYGFSDLWCPRGQCAPSTTSAGLHSPR